MTTFAHQHHIGGVDDHLAIDLNANSSRTGLKLQNLIGVLGKTGGFTW